MRHLRQGHVQNYWPGLVKAGEQDRKENSGAAASARPFRDRLAWWRVDAPGMKRITIIFDCGCSVSLWAQGSQLKEELHNCPRHGRSLEGKTVSAVSIDPIETPRSHSLGSRG